MSDTSLGEHRGRSRGANHSTGHSRRPGTGGGLGGTEGAKMHLAARALLWEIVTWLPSLAGNKRKPWLLPVSSYHHWGAELKQILELCSRTGVSVLRGLCIPTCGHVARQTEPGSGPRLCSPSISKPEPPLLQKQPRATTTSIPHPETGLERPWCFAGRPQGQMSWVSANCPAEWAASVAGSLPAAPKPGTYIQT